MNDNAELPELARVVDNMVRAIEWLFMFGTLSSQFCFHDATTRSNVAQVDVFLRQRNQLVRLILKDVDRQVRLSKRSQSIIDRRLRVFLCATSVLSGVSVVKFVYHGDTKGTEVAQRKAKTPTDIRLTSSSRLG